MGLIKNTAFLSVCEVGVEDNPFPTTYIWFTYLNVFDYEGEKNLVTGGFKIEFKPLHLYIELKFVWNIYFIELKNRF